MEINGIDVSKWQGDIDWKLVSSSGVRFAMIRLAHGTDMDARFSKNVKGAVKNGIKAGAYVFSLAGNTDEARAEALNAVKACEGLTISFPVAMDVENAHFEKLGKTERGKLIEAFCETVKASGMTPMIYSNRDWFTRLIPRSVMKKYPVWLAQWRQDKPSTDFEYAMWQYGKGHVDGIDGDVDLDICFKDFSTVCSSPIVFDLTVPRKRGEAFLDMQTALNAAGYTDDSGKPLAADGVWGKRSRQAFVKMLENNKA